VGDDENEKFERIKHEMKDHVKEIYDEHHDELEVDRHHKSKDGRVYAYIESTIDGGQYEGEVNEETNGRDGYGISILKDGSVYEGQWKNDKSEGKGFRVFVDRDYYIGDYVANKMVKVS
jgi:hypothetical protein